MVKFVENLEEFDNILSQAGNKLVVVDFTASWCGPCRMIGPVFEKLAEDSANKDVIFLKVDVDEASDVSQKCGIRCMPTFQFYKNGEKVDEFTGPNEKKLTEKIEQLRQ
ncbi:PREDICTED: thioredoxin-like [Poecilia mexicana]|uniref:Thioredoxin n=1 Tax=Poecilia mexicana TaxID=48701 RepID=A0A3B3XC82_9TELE|nr:PREDICTED: thioredoxin-like [Poecilia mexicana]